MLLAGLRLCLVQRPCRVRMLCSLRLPPLQRHSRTRMLLETTPAPVQRHSRLQMLLDTAPALGAEAQQSADGCASALQSAGRAQRHRQCAQSWSVSHNL